MEYVNLGNTGLKVSRICLGCMTYGRPATGKLLPGRQPWALNEADSAALLPPGPRSRHQFLGHRQRLLRRRQRNRHRPLSQTEQHPPRIHGHRHQGLQPHARRAQRPRPLPQSHPVRTRREPQAPRRPTTSTSTRPTAGITRRPSKKLSKPARCGQGRQGPLHRRIVHVRLAVRQGTLSLAASTAGPASSPCRTT